MTPIILLFGGVVLIWVGMTDTFMDVLGKAKETPYATGYPSISFIPYAIAAVAVTSPLVLIKDSKEWAWQYVLLILLIVAVYNYNGISKFSNDLNGIYNELK